MRWRFALLVVAVLVAILVAGLLSSPPGAATVHSESISAPTEQVESSGSVSTSAKGAQVRHVFVRTKGSPDSPRVLIVGDSTTVHMIGPFTAALEAKGVRATIDATSGRTTREGRAVLTSYLPDDFDYVVVLLGANGRRENALRDMRALRAMGVDTVATVQTPRRRRVNAAVRQVFGSDYIAWAGYAGRHGIRTTDGKHYTKRDYRARARYLAAQIAIRAS